jgi:predicted transposase/invertase (TIGR01784 family)
MRRDSIFYQLFQQSPELLFELLEDKPDNAQDYRFDSVAVKEPKFEIDGVFLPPEFETPGIIYFCEVQFQKDEKLYERLFGESFLYFYRTRDRFFDWQAVVIYPSRSIEQTNPHPYRALLSSDQVHRVFLDELGDIDQLPLGLALMVLTTLSEAIAPQAARDLLARSERESLSLQVRQGIIDMIGTIMVYKFTNLSRQEIDAMLGIKIEETRVYREAQEEKARAIALNMLKDNLPLEQISRLTGLTIVQLQQLQSDQSQQ